MIPPAVADTCEIYINDSQKVSYQIEVADTVYQKQQGLMYRTHLDKDKGMLFPFSKEQILTMWMKNTLIPLDMLFIDKNNQIVHIHQNANPQDETIISSKYPVQKVLEINAGEVKEKAIHTGMKMICF